MPLQDKLPHPILPDGTRNEIQARESYHLLKIMSEFVEAGEELRAIYPAVSIYGSARTPVNHPDYLLAELIAPLPIPPLGCGLRGDFRRRAGDYGGGQQGRVCRTQSRRRPQYRAAA